MAVFLLHLRAPHFGDHLPGFVQDGQPLGLRRVGTGETAPQRPKQEVLEMRRWQAFLLTSFLDAGKPNYKPFFMTSDLWKASLVAVFDHADEIGGAGGDKLGSECPHDWIQQQSTVKPMYTHVRMVLYM